MNILLISVWTNFSTSEKEYKVLDEKGDETDIIIRSPKASIAEFNYLMDKADKVTFLSFLPSFLSSSLNSLPSTYSELENLLKEKALQYSIPLEAYLLPANGVFNINGLTHIHDGGVGNYSFLIYYYTYKMLEEQKPDLIMLDLSETSSYLQYYSLKGVELAVKEYAYNLNSQPLLIAFSTDYTERLLTLSREIMKDIEIYNYLSNGELKLAKGFSTVGKSELHGIGIALKLGFPLALSYIIKNVEELISPEEFQKKILEGITITRNEKVFALKGTFRASTTAPYYFMGYHFVKSHKDLALDEVPITKIEESLYLYNEPARSLIKREIEIIKKLSTLIDDGEYLLSELIRIGNSRVLDWVSGNVKVNDKTSCDVFEDEMISHAGMGRYFTIVKKSGGNVTLSYSQQCIDNVISWVKSFSKQDD
jgi:hypothetical protein